MFVLWGQPIPRVSTSMMDVYPLSEIFSIRPASTYFQLGKFCGL